MNTAYYVNVEKVYRDSTLLPLSENSIQFKIWDIRNKKYLDENVPISFYQNGRFFIGAGHVLDYKNYIICRHTGLLDKNGTDIYEYDVYNLEGFDDNPYYAFHYKGIYYNRQVNESFEDFKTNGVNWPENMDAGLKSSSWMASIIGNIFTYENKH